MAYTVPVAANGDDAPPPPTVLLRRLANPNLAPQPNPAAAGYNPYVTVDYIDMSKVTLPAGGWIINDGRKYISTGKNPNYVAAVTSRYSFGRQQPYAGIAGQWKQQAPATPAANQPLDTFFSVNTPAAAPAKLAGSPGPPAHQPGRIASGFGIQAPRTDAAILSDVNGNLFGHVAPWMDPNSRLYRLLEFVKVKNLMPGVAEGGRVPGKVNINTHRRGAGRPGLPARWRTPSRAIPSASRRANSLPAFMTARTQTGRQRLVARAE